MVGGPSAKNPAVAAFWLSAKRRRWREACGTFPAECLAGKPATVTVPWLQYIL